MKKFKYEQFLNLFFIFELVSKRKLKQEKNKREKLKKENKTEQKRNRMQKPRGKPGKGQGHRPVRECAAAGNTDLLSVYVSRPKPIQPSPAHYASPLSYPLEEARRPAVAVAAAGGSIRPPQKCKHRRSPPTRFHLFLPYLNRLRARLPPPKPIGSPIPLSITANENKPCEV
jgi:hypothetical protein